MIQIHNPRQGGRRAVLLCDKCGDRLITPVFDDSYIALRACGLPTVGECLELHRRAWEAGWSIMLPGKSLVGDYCPKCQVLDRRQLEAES